MAHSTESPMGETGATPIDTQEFIALRPYLFAVAYRMLGSASEAEDILQDAYLRLHGAVTEPIVSAKAFLTKIVTRLCLDYLKSARVSRESYLGPWLPEPVLTTDLIPSPTAVVERRDDIS